MARRGAAGPVLKEWRNRRRLSQLALSNLSGVSTRHLSYVETGRARPSRELLLHLAAELDVPPRGTNEMLLAAGYAPVFSQHRLDADQMRPVAKVLELILRRSDPNPTTIIDSRWNLIDANPSALWLVGDVAEHLLVPPVNVARLSLHPDGLAPRIGNFAEFAAHLLHHMRRVLAITDDPDLEALIAELSPVAERAQPGWPHHDAVLPQLEHPDVMLPLRIAAGGTELSFLSTVTTFGTARDVTLSELSIETLYPADERSAGVLAARPWALPAGHGPPLAAVTSAT
jgi:transcriptional regulator with XRE-family HTH domain